MIHCPAQGDCSLRQLTEQPLPRLLPQLGRFINFAVEYRRFKDGVIRQEQNGRKVLQCFKEEKDNIIKQSNKIFNYLNKVLQEKIKLNLPKTSVRDAKPINAKLVQTQQNTVMSLPKQKKNVNIKIKTVPQVPFKQAQQNEKLYNLKNVSLLSKQQPNFPQIYTCLICFRINHQPCMWQHLQPYLTHMQQRHQHSLDFSSLIFDIHQDLACSHYYFKGELTNLLRNYQHWQSKYVLYLYRKQRYDKLYFCYCRKYCSTVYCLADQFFQHLQKYEGHRVSELSHFVRQEEGFAFFQWNPNFNNRWNEEKYRRSIYLAQKKWTDQINQFTLGNVLIMYPVINMLELISCNPHVSSELKSQDVYGPLPFCIQCQIYFKNQMDFLKHHKAVHRKKEIKRRSDLFREDFFRLGQIRGGIKGVNELEDENGLEKLMDAGLATEQESILKGQLYLIQKEMKKRTRFMICGECLRVFKRSQQKYIEHIYCEHKDVHPGSTHTFPFLIQKTLFDVEKDQNDRLQAV